MNNSNTDSSRHGAFPQQKIEQLVENNHIMGSVLGNIKPASLDLSLSDEIYKLEGVSGIIEEEFSAD